MSALSKQCEALRLWAKQLHEGEPALASDLREAADTILNLRDMAQQAQSEKAALERRIDELCAEVERLRQIADGAANEADRLTHDAAVLQIENAKLREQLAKARDPQRIGGTADPESFVYAIEQLREFRWQHATNDEEAIPYINNVADAHERENAKLREQVEYMTPIALYAASEQERDRMSELGIEVD